ncbi:hypothetical protein OSB04_003751 [Centaurea solstitialis]|uniref:Uncharacterized protein n=1 Tax=Centaurea solstitialis TaxID=347529 RepID=A0AA38WTX7_9ASTR|nr:hypothetical protein OSB04_003751 [Centaurea solstitialis]
MDETNYTECGPNRFSSTFKEILAVKRGIENFQFHLIGHHFQIEMDMSSFPKMLQFKRKMPPEAQPLRWSNWFSRWQFTMKHIKDTQNVLADFLSRPKPYKYGGTFQRPPTQGMEDIKPDKEILSVRTCSQKSVFYHTLWKQSDIYWNTNFVNDIIQALLSKFHSIIQEYGIMLSEKKMEIGVTSINFLGMNISDGKYQPHPHIAQELHKFPNELTTPREIQQFLGLVNYMADFLPKLSHTVHLFPMLKKNPPPWSDT